MVPRTLPHRRRQPRGFTLLLALGVVAVVTMAVMLSYGVVGREADSQADTRRQKQAFFAAEAGLAEGREAVRLVMGSSGGNTLALNTFGAAVDSSTGLGSPTRTWYELLPAGGGDGWNHYRMNSNTLAPGEVAAGLDFPEQDTRYRVFVRDDEDSEVSFDSDSNRQVWVISIAEVTTPNGRPTRAVVQALVTNTSNEAGYVPGSFEKGGGPAGGNNTNNDQRPPQGTDVIVINHNT
jgi:hypothetical protein